MSTHEWIAPSSGRFSIELTLLEAESVSHPGPCDVDVERLSSRPHIWRQLAALDAAMIRDELREYGAWNDADLSDAAENLRRILWIAGCDISEEEAAREAVV